jgi:hypothetical protein
MDTILVAIIGTVVIALIGMALIYYFMMKKASNFQEAIYG